MYSLDYRQRVLEIKTSEGLTYEETSKRFKVSMRTLFNWNREINPKLKRNKPATKIDMEALKRHVSDYPDHYHYERAEAFGVTTSAMFYALKRLGISYKKKRYTIPKRTKWHVWNSNVRYLDMSLWNSVP